VKRYHVSLRRAYEIIRDEMSPPIQMKMIVQMTIKTVNDSINLDEIVFILSIFAFHSRMTND
jgi:hypothetical protein